MNKHDSMQGRSHLSLCGHIINMSSEQTVMGSLEEDVSPSLTQRQGLLPLHPLLVRPS